MKLRRPPKLVTRSLKIRLPEAYWHRLDRLVEQAKTQGWTLDYRDDLANHIERQIKRLESELRKKKEPDGPNAGVGNESLDVNTDG